MQLHKLSTYVIAAVALASIPVFGWQPIAHRGVFHDVDDRQANSENTVGALYRADDLKMPGVELDLRLSSDGVVMVTHDVLSNRATTVDNYDGRLNSVRVALGAQPSVAGIRIDSRTGNQWNHTPLKIYGRNSQLVSDGTQKMETLDEMLGHFSDLIAGNGGRPFFLVLDIQNPEIFEKAADLVRSHRLQNSVYLKFFATSAIDSSSYRYQGAKTCAAYATMILRKQFPRNAETCAGDGGRGQARNHARKRLLLSLYSNRLHICSSTGTLKPRSRFHGNCLLLLDERRSFSSTDD